MTAFDKNIVDKIRKLLALAKSDVPGEAAAAAAAAQTIMEKYRISLAELPSEDGGEREEPVWEDVYTSSRRSFWKHQLLIVCAESQSCLVFTLAHTGSREKTAQLVGSAADVSACRAVYAWLLVELERMAETHANQTGGDRRSFLIGCVDGIRAQLIQAKEKAREGISATALTVVSRHEEELMEWAKKQLNEDIPKNPMANAVVIDEDALTAGIASGKSLHLGKRISTR